MNTDIYLHICTYIYLFILMYFKTYFGCAKVTPNTCSEPNRGMTEE